MNSKVGKRKENIELSKEENINILQKLGFNNSNYNSRLSDCFDSIILENYPPEIK